MTLPPAVGECDPLGMVSRQRPNGSLRASAWCGSLVAEPPAGEHFFGLECGLLELDRAPAGW